MKIFHWFSPARLLTGVVAAACFAGQSVMAVGNTGDIFLTTATDLSVGTNYTTTISPTAATTTDVQLSGAYGTTTLTINGTGLNFGTLDDIDTTQSLIITNSATNTAGTITLDTPLNSTSGSAAADLIYVKAAANLTTQSGAGSSTTTLDLNATGNIDDAGTLAINGPVAITSGDTITFTGAGTTSIGSALNIPSGSTVVAAGSGATLTLAGGGVFTGNFQVAAAGATRVNFDGGTFSGAGQIQVQTTAARLTNSNTAPASGPGTVSNAIFLNSNSVAVTKGTFGGSSPFYTVASFITSIGGTTSPSTTAPITFSGVISGNSDVVIANSTSTSGGGGGPVVLGLAGTNGGAGGYETYTGNTIFNGSGTVTLAAANILPTSTNVIGPLGSNAPTLLLNGFNQAIGSLSDGITVTASKVLTIENGGLANATLTIGSSLAGTQPTAGFSGAIVDGTGGGTLAIDKIGANSLTLSPYASSINTFSGGVTVNQGTLIATGSGALGAGSVIVNPTGTSGTSADSATLTTNGSSIGSAAALTVNTNSATAIGAVNFPTAAPGVGSLTGNGNVVLQSATGTLLTIGSATNNLSSTFSGAISEQTAGKGSVTKAGAGALDLSGTNTYTGATTVTAGSLLIDGSILGSSTTVQAGGTLGGSGTVGSVSLLSAGILAPGLEMSGETIKTLTASGLTWNSGGTMDFELSMVNSASDTLSLGSGALTEGTAGTFQFNFLGGGEAGQTYDLVNFGSTSFPNASAFSATDLGPGLAANFELSGSQLEVQIQTVPEPSAWGALAWGVGMLIGFRRFRRLGNRMS